MLNFDLAESKNLDTGDFLNDIITKSIESEILPSDQLKKTKTPSVIVPHNSLIDLNCESMAKIGKFVDGPIEVLEKGATIKCVNCGNMAKNMIYLENYIKSNGSKKSPCPTCSTALSFLEYLNKNIQQVFNNINNTGMFVIEKETVVTNMPAKTNSAGLGNPVKPVVKRTSKATSRNRAGKSDTSPVKTSAKSLDKVRTKKKKAKLVKPNPSSQKSVDGSGGPTSRPKVKKAHKRRKTPSATKNKLRQSATSK